MGLHLRRLLALALAQTIATVAVDIGPGSNTAWAQDEEEEEDEDEDEGDGDGSDDDENEESEEEDDEEQPKVTAGGLFTMATYPLRELARPLTLTEKITELRGGIGFDLSSEKAFESFGIALEGRYGYRDHIELQGGLTSAYNFKQFEFYGGVEAALGYDLVDVRAALTVRRAAVVDSNLSQKAGDINFGIDIGFPFRYVARKEIGITALDTFFTLLFTDKPTFAPALGIITNPIDAVSLVLRAQLIVPRFDFRADNFIVPVSLLLQFSPNQQIDLGAEFKFLDLTPPEGSMRAFYEDRFLTFFANYRM